ncbi:MAG: UPF0158 family protein [Bacteroidota bacterium]
MIKLSQKQVNEIAQLLDAGMKCYVNKDTGEFADVPDLDDMYGYEEFVQEEIEKIESTWSNYVIIEKMSSREGFRVMEDFTHTVTNKRMQDRLFNALNRRKPFSNFKHEVDHGGDIRQQWFDFKQAAYEAYVREELSGEFLFV